MDILLFPWAVAIKHIAYITLTPNTSSAALKERLYFPPRKKKFLNRHSLQCQSSIKESSSMSCSPLPTLTCVWWANDSMLCLWPLISAPSVSITGPTGIDCSTSLNEELVTALLGTADFDAPRFAHSVAEQGLRWMGFRWVRRNSAGTLHCSYSRFQTLHAKDQGRGLESFRLGWSTYFLCQKHGRG